MIITTNPTMHIAGVVRSPQLQYELGDATAGLGEVRLDLRVGELRSAGRQLLGSQARSDALLLDVDVEDAENLAVLARLAEQAGRASIPVVATAGDLGPAAMRRLLRDGVTDFIGPPIDHAEVVELVQVVRRKARRAQASKSARGRLLTFSRATGGACATTLAVNLAHALARPQVISAANRGTPALDARRYSRFGRQVRALLRQALRQLAARPALAAAH